jgi:hypothetical protein
MEKRPKSLATVPGAAKQSKNRFDPCSKLRYTTRKQRGYKDRSADGNPYPVFSFRNFFWFDFIFYRQKKKCQQILLVSHGAGLWGVRHSLRVHGETQKVLPGYKKNLIPVIRGLSPEKRFFRFLFDIPAQTPYL